jgi:hypothetical protein
MWYIFPRFGILCQEKSGSPGLQFNLVLSQERGEVVIVFSSEAKDPESHPVSILY